MSSKEVVLNGLLRLPNEIQTVRDDVSEVELGLKARISRCQAKVTSLARRVEAVLSAVKEATGGGGGVSGKSLEQFPTSKLKRPLSPDASPPHRPHQHSSFKIPKLAQQDPPAGGDVPPPPSLTNQDEEEHLPRAVDIGNSRLFHGTSKIAKEGKKMVHYCFCGRKIFTLKGMVSHFVQLTIGTKFKCGKCGSKFLLSHRLKEHSQVKHKVRTYPCHLCFQEMGSQEEYDYHMRPDVSECGRFLEHKIQNGEPYQYLLLM